MADPNRANLERAIEVLTPLLDELVFVGGCATGLHISDQGAAGIRPTRDVDAIVHVASYAAYAGISDRMRALGFSVDAGDGALMCRWRHGDLIMDLMPTDASILGFANRWYPSAIRTARTMIIAGRKVRVVDPVHFVATKLEAFRGRGHGDATRSHDLEDIVMVIDGREEIIGEIGRAEATVRDYIAATLGGLIEDRAFMDGLSGFLLPDAASQARRPTLEARLLAIARLNRDQSRD